jgi:hypothetical protein
VTTMSRDRVEMKSFRSLTVLVQEAEEGGYWAEVIEMPGCVSQGETLAELRANIAEAIEAVSPYSSSTRDPETSYSVGSDPGRPDWSRTETGTASIL